MTSTFTTNKSLEQPANGSDVGFWDQPVNADFGAIDACLGGHTTISVTGVASGAYALSLAQYQPPNIVFTGTISGNLVYVLPTGVGWLGTIYNNTSGAFTIVFAVSGGGSILVPQGERSMIVSDGANVQTADTAFASAAAAAAQAAAISASETYTNVSSANAITTAENFATTADTVVLSSANATALSLANTAESNAESFATAADTVVLASAQAFAAPGSSLTTNGSRKNPDGSITKWGLATMPSASPTTVMFPIAFPTACLNVVVSLYGQPQNYDIGSWSATGFVLNFSVGFSQLPWHAEGH
jgi:hypothetical protein